LKEASILDHVIVTVSDFSRSIAFCEQALKPLKITDLRIGDFSRGKALESIRGPAIVLAVIDVLPPRSERNAPKVLRIFSHQRKTFSTRSTLGGPHRSQPVMSAVSGAGVKQTSQLSLPRSGYDLPKRKLSGTACMKNVLMVTVRLSLI
jgi:hypothetical protein